MIDRILQGEIFLTYLNDLPCSNTFCISHPSCVLIHVSPGDLQSFEMNGITFDTKTGTKHKQQTADARYKQNLTPPTLTRGTFQYICDGSADSSHSLRIRTVDRELGHSPVILVRQFILLTFIVIFVYFQNYLNFEKILIFIYLNVFLVYNRILFHSILYFFFYSKGHIVSGVADWE